MVPEGSKDFYHALFDTFMAIPVGARMSTDRPGEEVVAAGERLAAVARQDRDSFVCAGLNPEYIDTLQARIGAFAYIAAYYDGLLDKEITAEKEWEQKASQGYSLKKRLSHALSSVFRNEPELLEKVKEIERCRENGNIVIDLLALYVLGKLSAMRLRKSSFDFTGLESAKALREELSVIVGRIISNRSRMREAGKILDCAYTYLMQAVNEIKEYGQFVFFNDPDRQKTYVSDFWHKLFENEKYDWEAVRSCKAAA
jgi:hypothetical protein